MKKPHHNQPNRLHEHVTKHYHQLSSAEKFHISDIANNPLLKKVIPDDVKESLVRQGHIKHVVGGHILTETGKFLATMAKK